MVSIAAKFGCAAQTLHEWVKKAEVDGGKLTGVPTDTAERMKALEREVRELARPTRSCARRARPPTHAMIAFIEAERDVHGVEPICNVLPIAPSTSHERARQRRDPSRLSARAKTDRALKPEIIRVFTDNFAVYGVRKVWRQLKREGFDIARGEAVEYATLEWVDWFDNPRLLETIGSIPPAEAEANYYAMLDDIPWPRNSNPSASGKPGAVLYSNRQPE